MAALGLNVVGADLGGNIVEDEADVDDAAAAAVSVGGVADGGDPPSAVVVVAVDVVGASAETCGPSIWTSMSTTPPPAVEPTGFSEVDRRRLTRSLSTASPTRVA